MIKQKAAIHKAAVLGLRIQEEYPEVKNMYLSGDSLSQITTDLDLETKYGVNFSIAREAVRKAITGYNGQIQKFRKKYPGLIKDIKEQKRLASEHRNVFKRNVSNYSLQAIIARGEQPWIKRKETKDLCTLSETEFVYMLSKSPEFFKNNKLDLKKIAYILNEAYHKGDKIRTTEAIYCKLARFKGRKPN